MSRPIALLASGAFTLFLLGVIGFLFIWNAPVPAAASATASTVQPAGQDPGGDPQVWYQAQVEQVQAALAEREAQYQTRLADLQQMAQDREAEYLSRLGEADAQINTVQTQTDKLAQAAAAYREQSAQLEQALAERNALFSARRQEFESQRQERLTQLQAQLADGQARLQKTNAQLGR